MSLAEIVLLVLKVSILVIVFAIGLEARPADLGGIVRRPGKLIRSLLVMVVLMPLVAVFLVRTIGLPHPVAVMLIALALAPVPPILPRKQGKAGGDASYALGLLVAAGLLSVVWIPMALELIERTFGVPLGVAAADIARLVAMTILLPLGAGILVARFAPGLAARLAPLLSLVGSVLLLLCALAILITQWSAIAGLARDGALLAIAVFVAVGLLAGHLAGGPDPEDRTVLAIATATRHPGVALAIASANFPQEKALAAAVLLFILANAALTAPYVMWRKRAGAADSISGDAG